MIACTHVNEGKRCGAKKWCPVILNGVASFVILNGAFGGVKDLRYGTGTVILNRVKDLGHGMMVTFITDEYVEVYQILRCRSE